MEINIGNIIVEEEINIGGFELDLVKEYPPLEDLEVTPSGVEQNFKSTKYGYDNVKVKAVESDTLNIIPTETEQQHIGLYGIVNVDKIPSEYVKTEGTLEITDNGEYNVKTYEKANVNIEKKEDLSAELQSKIIGFHKHSFGFEGMIQIVDKDLFSFCEITKPSLEEIMVHIER